jgi:hypothetical protein
MFLILPALLGCDRSSPKSTGAEAGAAQKSQVDSTRSARIAEWEKPYEWTQEKIKRHHAKLVRAELPAYIVEVWGRGGRPYKRESQQLGFPRSAHKALPSDSLLHLP